MAVECSVVQSNKSKEDDMPRKPIITVSHEMDLNTGKKRKSTYIAIDEEKTLAVVWTGDTKSLDLGECTVHVKRLHKTDDTAHCFYCPPFCTWYEEHEFRYPGNDEVMKIILLALWARWDV
jgi:hypothetical protein